MANLSWATIWPWKLSRAADLWFSGSLKLNLRTRSGDAPACLSKPGRSRAARAGENGRDCWAACQVTEARGSVPASSPGGFCSVVADVRDHGVQGGLEGIGGVLGLGEKQNALHGGEQ